MSIEVKEFRTLSEQTDKFNIELYDDNGMLLMSWDNAGMLFKDSVGDSYFFMFEKRLVVIHPGSRTLIATQVRNEPAAE